MKKLITRISLFSLPFVLLGALILFVDPYEYYNYFNCFSHKDKLSTSLKLNPPLWKLIHYKHAPIPNILLGDSRMNQFSTDDIEKLTGIEYANLAYGAGTLSEICETFWETAAVVNLKKVYIGLNLNLYNKSNASNRVEGVKAIFSNPLLYVVNRNVIHSTFLLIKNRFGSRDNEIIEEADSQRPKMTKEAFWLEQLGETTSRYYANYSKPNDKYLELKKISQYCKQRRIKLVFIIPPTHEDLRKKARDFGLEEAEHVFRKDLTSLGTVYDFDYPNELTVSRENFDDPYHVKKDKGVMLIEEVWGNKLKYARIISQTKETTQIYRENNSATIIK